MKFKRVTCAAAVGLIVAALGSGSALAVPTFYQLGSPGGSVSAHAEDPGLVVHTQLDPGLANLSFSLNDGDSHTFPFFRIWTTESTVNVGEDTLARPITATLNFSTPSANPEFGGDTFGVSIALGAVQYGRVEWAGPQTITLADRAFTIALSDETFSAGVFGLSQNAATVRATVTQLSSVTPPARVPDMANTAILLGLALLGLEGMRRRFAMA